MPNSLDHPAPDRARTVILIVLAVAALLQCWRFQPLLRSVQADNQLYFFVAERAASGIPPHVSLVDHKHQLPGLLSGAAIAAGRIFGVDDVMAGRTLSIAIMVVIVLAMFELATVLTGDAAAGLLAAVALLGFRTLFLEAAIGFRPQLFMTAFTVLGHLAFARGRPFLAGILAAAAFLCWQPAALVGMAMFIAALAGRSRSPRTAAWLAVGGIAAVAAYESYFVWHGVLAEQLRQSYRMAGSAEGFRPPAVMETIEFLTREIGRGRTAQDYLTFAMLSGFFGLVSFAVIAPEKTAAAWTRSAPWRAVTLAAGGAVAFTFVDHQAYPDRFFYLPYVALTAGALPIAATQWLRSRRLRAVVLVSALLALGASTLRSEREHPLTATLAKQRAAAGDLAALAAEHHGSLWVVGRPDLLAFNRMNNWTPFGMLLDARVRAYATERSGDSVYRPLRDRAMPEVILAARVKLRRYLPWLEKEYELLQNSKGWNQQHITAYVRRPANEVRRTVDSADCGRTTTAATAAPQNRRTASDALFVLRAALGVQSCKICVCDADGSSKVTAADSLRLLRRTTASDVPLLCPPCPE